MRAVRNARAEYGVEPGRRIAATLAVDSPELRAALEAEADVLALLAKLERSQVGGCRAANGGSVAGCDGAWKVRDWEVL